MNANREGDRWPTRPPHRGRSVFIVILVALAILVITWQLYLAIFPTVTINHARLA